jgi:hypothetical protein
VRGRVRRSERLAGDLGSCGRLGHVEADLASMDSLRADLARHRDSWRSSFGTGVLACPRAVAVIRGGVKSHDRKEGSSLAVDERALDMVEQRVNPGCVERGGPPVSQVDRCIDDPGARPALPRPGRALELGTQPAFSRKAPRPCWR